MRRKAVLASAAQAALSPHAFALHPAITAIRGRVGDRVYKTYGRKIIVTRVPVFTDHEPTSAQRTQRDRLREATAYAQRIYADPAAKAVYVAAAKKLGRHPFRLAVADFLSGCSRVSLAAVSALHASGPTDLARFGNAGRRCHVPPSHHRITTRRSADIFRSEFRRYCGGHPICREKLTARCAEITSARASVRHKRAQPLSNQDLINFIWQIADLLRGPYRPPQYERVMLPLVVLRRFDCVLADTKKKVLAEFDRRKGGKISEEALDSLLNRAAGPGFRFHNRSPYDFDFLKSDPDHIDQHLQQYINGFSANVRRIFDFFGFTAEIEQMREANILYLVVSKFCDVDLHPDKIDNIQMGLVFEDLIRRFNEQANETAGDHFTPREVIELMVHLLFYQDDALLSKPGTIRKLLDPTCGTGGMLAVAQGYLREHHEEAALYVYGQDYNKRSYAVAYSDLLIKGHENSRVEYGDTLLPDEDRFKDQRFDYFLANPPFGVDWKKQQKEVKAEHDKQGFAGRFGAGLPRVNDGSLLFLQHMIAKFEPVQPDEQKHGSRLAIVFNGSPLFTGGAGSGESDIRKWIIENDWLEAIVALPEQMFYNTGIGTYIWLVTNRKSPDRRGKIQLIDARARWTPMRRSLGQKRRQIGDDDIAAIVREYGKLKTSETSRVFANADFGYRRVTVERPLRLRFQIDTDRKARFLDAWPHWLDELQAIDQELGRKLFSDWNEVEARIKKLLRDRDAAWNAPVWKTFREVFTDTDPKAAPVIASSGNYYVRGAPATPDAADRIFGYFPDPAGKAKKIFRYEPDTKLRDFENIPLTEDVIAYFKREVLPHVPDAWIDDEKTKVGYEVNFNRHFYRYTPPRPLAEIDADLKAAEAEILRLLGDVTHAAPPSP